MPDELPYVYKKILQSLREKTNSRAEASVEEFKQTVGQSIKAKKSEWFPIAKDMEGFGVMKIKPGKTGLEVFWPDDNPKKQ